MHGFIERSLLERRSLEQTLADLVTKNRSLPSGKQSAEFTRMITDQFDELYREGATRPKVMAVCLHPYAVTSPSRLKYLREALEHILSFSGVWMATGGEIADWYYANYHGKRYPVLEAAGV